MKMLTIVSALALAAFGGAALASSHGGSPAALLMATCMVGALSAFLLFNVPTSRNRGVRTFMGDTGSLALGGALGVIAVAAHHEEVKPETIYAGLLILADTVSATRPGARAESMTGYIQRLGRLEKLALSLEGVQQAFAIQAGREIRVVVSPTEVTDDRAREIARELRKRIETELQYPSTIRITVIREARFTETAT